MIVRDGSWGRMVGHLPPAGSWVHRHSFVSVKSYERTDSRRRTRPQLSLGPARRQARFRQALKTSRERNLALSTPGLARCIG